MSVYLSNQPNPDEVEAALRSEAVHSILLLEMRFASGTVYLSNALLPFTDSYWGYTWEGAGNVTAIGDVEGGPGNLAPYREYALGLPWSVLDSDEIGVNGMGRIPQLIGNPSEYVNRAAILYEQVRSNTTTDRHGRPKAVGIPTAIHFGIMDRVQASYSAQAAIITLSVEGPLARKGAPIYGNLTPRDQKRRHTGDKGLDYVPEVISTNPKWTDW